MNYHRISQPVEPADLHSLFVKPAKTFGKVMVYSGFILQDECPPRGRPLFPQWDQKASGQ